MKVISLTDYRQYKQEKALAPLGDLYYRNFTIWFRWKRTGFVQCSQIVFAVDEETPEKQQ